MDNHTLYNDFINEVQRLQFNEPLQRIAIDYVYKQIPDDKAFDFLKQGVPDFKVGLLTNKLVYTATLNALHVMKVSNDKADFIRKIKKHIAKNQVVNFDDILNKLLKIKP